MDGINRKPVQDVLIPQNDLANRPSLAPEPHFIPSSRNTGSDRIESNPFFAKDHSKERTPFSGGRSSRKILWLLVIVAVLGALFLVMNYFTRATVLVAPLSWRVHIEEDLTATKEDSAGGLVFQFMSLKEEKSEEVEPTIEKKIQKKASGKVVIYNAYSGDSQRLIKNTRLESPDHKIFRINDSVVVPGAKVAAGKVIEPGSVEAVVYADAPGKDYNIGLSDFTIPGFKGDPRYTKFTAKSKADSPIGGGFAGTVKVPTDEAVSAAQTKLKDELKMIAVEKARGQVPKEVSFFPGSMVVKFEEVPEDLNAGDVTQVTMRAVVSVFFFDRVALTKKLAEGALTDYQGTPLVLENLPALSFAFVDPVDTAVLSDLTRIRFTIVGDAEFLGQIDTEKVRASLAGKEKKDFATIIRGQDNIAKADAVIRPMWNTKFPLDTQKITIKVANSEK